MIIRESGRPVVMGVLNITADSFSDGGRFLDLDAAVTHGRALVSAGADIVDVGGESTRPGAIRVDPNIEGERVAPVIAALTAAGVVCSVDTMRAEVAERALAAGATYINDVSGGRADPRMAQVAAAAQVPWILMHWRPTSGPDYIHLEAAATYDDVVADVQRELADRVDAALVAGVRPENLVLDPGLGFAKHAEHNWALLRALPAFVAGEFPILIGASRKRFLGELLADADGPRSTAGRDIATATISALAAQAGVWGIRVHDVQGTVDALAVVQQWGTGNE